MTDKTAAVDYYKILQCERDASSDDLRKNYQRLALNSHPDKIASRSSEEDFLIIQKAWSVLRNPETRRQYDATLICQECTDFLLYDCVSVDEMNFKAEEQVYTYDCRCGGIYVLAVAHLKHSEVILPCDECSFSIQVKVS